MNKTTDHFKRTIQAYLDNRAAEDKPLQCQVVVNHTVELTDEEKAEARQQAIRQYQAEELRKLQNRNKAKASQKTNAQQVELSLF